MSKHSGVSQLADVARELTSPRSAHYPVRRKGERRRLNPNLDGIAWLEGRCTDGEDFIGATEIIDAHPHAALSEYVTHRARGWYSANRAGNFPRPMFQTLPMGLSSSSMVAYSSCPDCDDWSRTAECGTHHDLDGVAGIHMGAERRRARTQSRDTSDAVLALRVYDQIFNQSEIIEVVGETLQGLRGVTIEIEGRWTDRVSAPTWLC